MQPVAGSLTYRQVTRGAGWRLEATWITDPRRATVLARVRLQLVLRPAAEAVRARRPRAGQRRRRRPRVLAAVGAGGVRRHGRLGDPRHAAAAAHDQRLRRLPPATRAPTSRTATSTPQYDATAPGNVVQAAETRLDGVRRRDLTLAIGFGADARAARQAAAGQPVRAGGAPLRERLGGLPAVGAPAAEAGARLAAHAAPLPAVDDGARGGRGQGQPRRLDRLAEHAVGVGHARRSRTAPTPAPTTSSGRATSTTSPPRRRWRATGPPPGACSTTCGACRSRTARSGRTRGSTASRAG